MTRTTLPAAIRLLRLLPAMGVLACVPPEDAGKDTAADAAAAAARDDDGDGFAEDAGDCDDANALVYPGADDPLLDAVDQSCDGVDGIDADGDGVARRAGDCDDTDPARYSGATDDTVDGVDQDCDRFDGVDADGDGVASAASGGTDCEDGDAAVFPGAAAFEADVCGPDADGDGYAAVDAGGTDCEDGDATVHPLAFEDEACLLDADGDGWGDASAGGSDCHDDRAAAYPGIGYREPELCGHDDDRDGWVDEASGGSDCVDDNSWVYPGSAVFEPDGVTGCDADQDGWADVADGGHDCDDANIERHPGYATHDPYACGTQDEVDADGDNWGSIESGGTDCEDWFGAIFPGAAAYEPDLCTWDYDADGWGNLSYGGSDCDDDRADMYPGRPSNEPWLCGRDDDGDGYAPDYDGGTDCYDFSAGVRPGWAEQEPAFCGESSSVDADDDGWASTSVGGTDCRDGDASVFKGAGSAEPDKCGADADGDGWASDASGYGDGSDCDDQSVAVRPGAAPEAGACDGFDANCDGWQPSVPGTCATIQAALNAATGPSVVDVAPGTYYESIDFMGKPVHLRGVGGSAVTTIAIAEGSTGSVVKFWSGETQDSVLEGFTIRDGSGTPMGGKTVGGGVLIYGASPTLRDLVVVNNSAGGSSGQGGGVYAKNSHALLEGVWLVGNISGHYGGNMYIEGGVVVVRQSMFNTGRSPFGPDLAVFEGRVEVANSMFLGEGASNSVDVQVGSARFDYSTFVYAGLALDDRGLTDRGSQYSGNGNIHYFAPVSITPSLPVDIRNSILHESPVSGGPFALGTTNMTADPTFVGVGTLGMLDWDVHLAAGSPAIDHGDVSVFDIDGSRSDAGAFGGPYGDWTP